MALLLLGTAGFLRLHRLDELPGSLWYDEAQNGVDALSVIAGERPVFFPANNGREPLFIYLQAIAVALLGPTPVALRIVSAFVGLATIGALYAVGRELHGARAGYLAALWLAVSYWHLSLSRLGFRAVSLPLAELGALYFVVRALRTGGLGAAGLAGLSVGLSLYTYSSARLFPLALLICVGALCWGRRKEWGISRSRALGVVAVLAAVAAFTALPLGLYLVRHPEFVFGRAQQVAIEGPTRSLPENAAVTLGMFGVGGDENVRHNLPGRPVFDLPTFALFLSGVIFALRRQHRWIGLLYLPWLLLLMAPGAVTTEAPHFLRTVGALPPAFLLLGIAGDRLLQRPSLRGQRLALAALALLLIYGAADTANAYFRSFASHPDRDAAFDARIATVVEQARQWRAAGFAVWTVARQAHPSFSYLPPPPLQPIGNTSSLAEAIAAAHAAGGRVALECFGCEGGDGEDGDAGRLVLVAARGASPAQVIQPVGRSVLDGAIEFVGYELHVSGSGTRAAEDTLPFEAWLHWRSRDAVGKRYRPGLVLFDSDGNVVAAGGDQWAGHLWPTTLWRPGEQYATVARFQLPGDLIAAGAELRLVVELTEVPIQPGRPGVAERIELGTVRMPKP